MLNILNSIFSLILSMFAFLEIAITYTFFSNEYNGTIAFFIILFILTIIIYVYWYNEKEEYLKNNKKINDYSELKIENETLRNQLIENGIKPINMKTKRLKDIENYKKIISNIEMKDNKKEKENK